MTDRPERGWLDTLIVVVIVVLLGAIFMKKCDELKDRTYRRAWACAELVDSVGELPTEIGCPIPEPTP